MNQFDGKALVEISDNQVKCHYIRSWQAGNGNPSNWLYVPWDQVSSRFSDAADFSHIHLIWANMKLNVIYILLLYYKKKGLVLKAITYNCVAINREYTTISQSDQQVNVKNIYNK